MLGAACPCLEGRPASVSPGRGGDRDLTADAGHVFGLLLTRSVTLVCVGPCPLEEGRWIWLILRFSGFSF